MAAPVQATSPAPAPEPARPPAAPLPSIYADATHYDLLAQMTAPRDLPFYLRQVERHGGPLLELGCGTGRVCLAIAERGTEVAGLDLSLPLLARARSKALGLRVPVALHHADCRDFDLGRRFALVIFPYNGFNHLLDLGGVRGCLAAVRRHLGDGGRLVIDTFNPSVARLACDPEVREPILRFLDPYLGEQVVMRERNRYDHARQVNRITWYYEIAGEREARVDELEMRIFFPQELDALLALNGFAIEHKYGDYDERPFESRCPKQLVVCRPAVP
ncbi:MAG: class I SAM-dependent methyltransferase [Deltaproteobacteria bacterium]|nr:class I SAM-dependent methyltransferase [Deltaproteobacteria bacterium]